MDESFTRLLQAFDERVARRMLQDFGTPQALRAFDRFAAETRGRKWLAEGVSLNEVAHRIGARAEVAVETAYRWLREMKKD